MKKGVIIIFFLCTAFFIGIGMSYPATIWEDGTSGVLPENSDGTIDGYIAGSGAFELDYSPLLGKGTTTTIIPEWDYGIVDYTAYPVYHVADRELIETSHIPFSTGDIGYYGSQSVTMPVFDFVTNLKSSDPANDYYSPSYVYTDSVYAVGNYAAANTMYQASDHSNYIAGHSDSWGGLAGLNGVSDCSEFHNDAAVSCYLALNEWCWIDARMGFSTGIDDNAPGTYMINIYLQPKAGQSGIYFKSLFSGTCIIQLWNHGTGAYETVEDNSGTSWSLSGTASPNACTGFTVGSWSYSYTKNWQGHLYAGNGNINWRIYMYASGNGLLGELLWTTFNIDNAQARIIYTGNLLPTASPTTISPYVTLKAGSYTAETCTGGSLTGGYNYWNLNGKTVAGNAQFIFNGASLTAISFRVFFLNATNYHAKLDAFDPSVLEIRFNSHTATNYGTYATYTYPNLDGDPDFVPLGGGTAQFPSFVQILGSPKYDYVEYELEINYESFKAPAPIELFSGTGTHNFVWGVQPWLTTSIYDSYITEGSQFIVNARVGGVSTPLTIQTFHGYDSDLALWDQSFTIGNSFIHNQAISFSVSVDTDKDISILWNPIFPSSPIADWQVGHFAFNFTDATSPIREAILVAKSNSATVTREMNIYILGGGGKTGWADLSIQMSELGVGSVEYWFILQDQAGNYNTSTSVILDVEASAPVVTSLAGNPVAVELNSGEGIYVMEFDAYINTTGHWNVTVNGEFNSDGNLAYGHNLVEVNLPTTALGTWFVNCSANKTLGPEITTLMVTFKVYQAPQFSIMPIGPYVKGEDTGILTVHWNASDDNPRDYTITRNNSLYLQGSFVNNSDNVILLNTGWADGRYLFNLTVFDQEGWFNSTLFNFTIQLSMPLVSSQDDIEYYLSAQDIILEFDCEDSSLDGYVLYVNKSDNLGGELHDILFVGIFNESIEILTLRLDGLLEVGIYQLILEVNDTRGHTTKIIFYAEVLDDPPNIQFNLGGFFTWVAIGLVGFGLLFTFSRSRSPSWEKNKKKIIGISLAGIAIVYVVLAIFNVSPIYSYRPMEWFENLSDSLGAYGPIVLVAVVGGLGIFGGYIIYRVLKRRTK